MLFELRTYDLKPGRAMAYLEAFRTVGLGLVTRHLPMLGYWMAETGRLNRIEHLWAYADFAERDRCRAALSADRDWMEGFVPGAFVDVVVQTNRFLRLETGSAAFDAAVRGRKTHHQSQPPHAPVFAPALHALTIGAADAGGTPIAAFRVLSGPSPGQPIGLATLAAGDLPDGPPGAEAHEILRPLAISPLR